MFFRQCLQTGQVDPDGQRLIKGADHIFAQSVVDGDFAADTAVYLRQQTGRDLNEVDAPLIDAGCKSCQIADHTTAQGQNRTIAMKLAA